MLELLQHPMAALAICAIAIGFSKGCDVLSRRVPYLRARRARFMPAALIISLLFLGCIGQIPVRYALHDALQEYQGAAPVASLSIEKSPQESGL